MKGQILALIIVSLLVVLAGGGAVAESAQPPGQPDGAMAVVAALRQAGAVVEPCGEVSVPYLSGEGLRLRVNGADVQTFEYGSLITRQAESDLIAPNGRAIGSHLLVWEGEPHFWAWGRVIALYVGDDENVRSLLGQVMGEPLEVRGVAGIYAAAARRFLEDVEAIGLNSPASVACLSTDDGEQQFDLWPRTGKAPDLPHEVQKAVADALLDVPVAWVSDGQVRDRCANIVLGAIRFQVDGKAIVSLAGAAPGADDVSKTYLLVQMGGVWRVQREAGGREDSALRSASASP